MAAGEELGARIGRQQALRIGEAGTIVSTCTVYNAVIDALEPFGVTSIRMPMTPERVFDAISKHGR